MLTYLALGQYGRCGNQLFQIASTIGIATKLGYNYGFQYWQGTGAMKTQLPPVENITYTPVHIPWGFHQVQVPDHTNLTGYLQSPAYFEHCTDLIRHYFTLKELSNYPIEPDSVSIHIRLGDYKKSMHHTIQTAGWYREALDKIQYTGKAYLFSDEPELAYSLLSWEIENLIIPSVQNSFLVDFYLMTRCRHHIISASSFSWWAAWLANACTVIAPRNWFGPAKKLDPSCLYCKNWIIQ